jgi:hypothetical protein
MAHAVPKLSFLRLAVFIALSISCWALWLVQESSARSETGGWLLFASVALLFAWSFVLYSRERLLAWLCWLTVVATFFLSLWLR